jgi:hypothetical protein
MRARAHRRTRGARTDLLSGRYARRLGLSFERNPVLWAEWADAGQQLLELRRQVKRQAAAAARESYALLYGADALRVCKPAGSLRDFLYGLDPRELVRLSAWWSSSSADSVDNVAMRLRASLPALEQLSDDDVMRRVWLHHTRVIDAAKAVATGKLPSARRFSGAVDVAQLAPGVESDGFDVTVLFGDNVAATHMIVQANRTREMDDAYRSLDDAATPRLGPAAWLMTVESYEHEIRSLSAGLAGDDVLAVSEWDARERLSELLPKSCVDDDVLVMHARICDLATVAGLYNLDNR